MIDENRRLVARLDELQSFVLGNFGATAEPEAPPPPETMADEQFDQLTPAQQRRILKEEIRVELSGALQQEVDGLRAREIAPIRKYLTQKALVDQSVALIDKVGQKEFDRLVPKMAEIAVTRKTDDVSLCYDLAVAEELKQQVNQTKQERKVAQVRAAGEKPNATASGTTKTGGQPTDDEIAEDAFRRLPPEAQALLA